MQDVVAASMTANRVGQYIESLERTIIKFNKQSDKYSKRMFVLIWVIACLTLVMTVAVFVQIWIALD